MRPAARLFSLAIDLAGAGPAVDGLCIAAGQQVAAIGDSITESGGYLRAIDAVFDQQYADLGLPQIVNVGVSGQKAEDMVQRFDRDVVRGRPAWATISAGINDVWHRLDQPNDDAVLRAFRRNVEQMVRMAQAAGIRVCLLSPTVIEEDEASEGNQRLAAYVAAGRDVAAETACLYVDLHGLFLRVVEESAGRRAGGQSVPSLTCDGVHMAPLGDALMALGILRALGVPDARIAATDLDNIMGSEAA